MTKLGLLRLCQGYVTLILKKGNDKMSVYDDKMEVLSNEIITGLVQNKDERLQIMSTFSPDLFTNENYIIYKVILNFREENLVPDSEFLKIYLQRNQELIVKDEQKHIDQSLYSTDNDYVNEVIASTIKSLQEYKSVEVDEDYLAKLQLDKQKFKQRYKANALSQIMENTSLILKDSLKQGHRVLSGADDSQEYFIAQTTRLNSLVSEESQGLYYIDEIELNDKQTAPRKIGDFGDLQFLTEQFGGIYTGMFYNIMAPTKGGKSKFCYRQLHNVAVRSGHTVLMWSYEGGKEKAKAELRAIHFVYYWEQIMHKTLTEDTVISAKEILQGDYPSQEIQDMEHESSLDLENNADYGKIAFIDRPLNMDIYEDTMRQYIEEVKPDLVIVDYLQLIMPAEHGEKSKLSKGERIGQTYQLTLALCKEYNIAFMSPAQMKQDAIKSLADDMDSDSRTFGGESAEIIRTPDYNVALYGTPEDIEHNTMKLLSIPSREAQPFSDHEIGVQLGISYYYDLEEDN